MTKKYVKVASVLLIALTTFLFSSHVAHASEQPHDVDQQMITIRLEEKSSNQANGGSNGQTNHGTGYLPKTGAEKEGKLIIWGIIFITFSSILLFCKSRRKRTNT